jgi:hypothetical protein
VCASTHPSRYPHNTHAGFSALYPQANGNLEKVIELRSDWAFQNKKGESGTAGAVGDTIHACSWSHVN